MDSTITATSGEVKRDYYSVWALPQEELTPRLKKLMEALRSEFGGPQFEPHVTVVGAISLTESEARDKFNKACEKLKPYCANVDKVGTGTFYYQCVYLLLHPTPEVTLLMFFSHFFFNGKRNRTCSNHCSFVLLN